MKKYIIIILVLFFLTGCADYREINQLAIATAIGVEKNGDMLLISAQILSPQKTGEKSSGISSTVIYKVEGRTMNEALKNLANELPNYLFLSHIEAFIIDSEILEKSKDEIKDYLSRYDESKLNYNIFVTDTVKPSEIITILIPIKDTPTLYVNSLLETNIKSLSTTKKYKFLDFITDDLEFGLNPVFPLISATITKEEKEQEENVKLDEHLIYTDNLITYNSKGEKLKLSAEESMSYNIITNHFDNSSLTIACQDKYFTVNIKNAKSNFKSINNGVRLTTKSNGEISEFNCKNLDLGKEKDFNTLEEIITKEVKNKLENTIKKAIENNNDFLGIGNFIYKNHPKYFNFLNGDWDYKGLTNITINVDFKFTLYYAGELKKGLNIKETYEKD